MIKIIYGVILFLYSISLGFSCIPYSPNEIIIWVYQWEFWCKNPEDNSTRHCIALAGIIKPFWLKDSKFGEFYFLQKYGHADYEENFDLRWYNTGDTIITIASANNWNYEKYFAVSEIAKLIWSGSNMQIVDKQWSIMDWWKKLWQCGNFRPDDVMNERDLITKLSKINWIHPKVEENKVPTYEAVSILVLWVIMLGSIYFFRRDREK